VLSAKKKPKKKKKKRREKEKKEGFSDRNLSSDRGKRRGGNSNRGRGLYQSYQGVIVPSWVSKKARFLRRAHLDTAIREEGPPSKSLGRRKGKKSSEAATKKRRRRKEDGKGSSRTSPEKKDPPTCSSREKKTEKNYALGRKGDPRSVSRGGGYVCDQVHFEEGQAETLSEGDDYKSPGNRRSSQVGEPRKPSCVERPE